jgi:hypothetical protein
MFILLRRIERWLHQHIFKVGWLLTQNYQTTTILYYTIFLPGVVLHELVYWLSAGMMNVRAERAIKWPEAQEVGELKLNFVRINPKASILRKAIISVAPLLVGLVIIWYIAANIFDITAVVRQMSSGNLRDVGTALGMLLSAPLFWLWVYVIFTIANTMYPSVPKDLQGWRSVLISLSAVAGVLLLLGLGGEIFEAMQSPLSELIFVLQATFALMIAIDVLMVLVLGLIEYTIEHVTGNSATFRGGKMITVTREEALEEQRKQREAELKEQAKRRNPAADTGLKSIYGLAFSIPGIPPQEPLTLLREHSQASLEMPAVAVEAEEEEKKPAAMPLFGGIAATSPDAPKPISEEQKQDRAAIAARINLPERLSPKPEEKAAAASTEAPVKEDKPQIASVEKLGTAETELEEKPVASRFGGFSKPIVTSPEEESSEEAEEKPVASRFAGFSKPVVTAPKEEVTDEAEDEVEEKPVASRFAGFSKPAITSPIEDDESEEANEKPVASRFGGFNKPTVASPKEYEAETDEAEEKPVASRFGGFNKPAVTAPQEDEDEAEEEKPVASRFGGFSKPAVTAPKEDDEAEEEAEEKPVASRFGGFNKPAVTAPKDEEAEDEEKPVASPFAGFSKPAVTTPKDEDEVVERPVASRFGDFSKPTITLPIEDDESEEAEAEKPVASRLGGFNKPAVTAPKDEEAAEEEKPSAPATSRFTGFSKPSGESASPMTNRFGSSPFKPIGEEDKTEKPSVTSGRFASTETRRVDIDDEEDEKPASRFGSSPFATPRPAPKSPDKEDDSEEEDEKPVSRFGTSTFGKTSPLGTSRPAPKSPSKDEDEEDEDEQVSRPSSPILGRPSAFGTSRPAPKAFSRADEDDEDSEDEESAPRSRVSGFGLLGKRPKDDDIVYEDDEDDFRDYDDEDDYVDSDDD